MTSKSKRGTSGNPAVRQAQREAAQAEARHRLLVSGVPMTVPLPGAAAPAPAQPGPPQFAIDQLKEAIQELVKANMAGIQDLQSKGVTFDQGQILNGRIDVLASCIAEALGPQGELWNLNFMHRFETAMANNIAATRQNGTKAMLAQGAAFSPGAIRDLARQTGTFGGR